MTFFDKLSVHVKKTSINYLLIEFLYNKLYIIEIGSSLSFANTLSRRRELRKKNIVSWSTKLINVDILNIYVDCCLLFIHFV